MGENVKGQGNLSSETCSKEDARLNQASLLLPSDPPTTQEDCFMLSLLNGASSHAPVIAPELESHKRVFASSD